MSFKGHIPVELIESIKQNKCILFVGSGISSSVQRSNGKSLPTWHSFLIELLEFAESKNVQFWNGPKEIMEMIEKHNYQIAAQEIQDSMPVGDFSEFLNLTFRDPSVKPSKTHEILLDIPFRAIMTSNYDNLLEGAYTLKNKGQLPLKFISEDLTSVSSPLRKNDFFIFKLHGDIDRPDSIVLGVDSYNNLLFKSPEYLSFLQTLFTTHTVLFVGFGGSDNDIDYVIDRLSTIYSKSLHKHYILLPEEKYNLTERRRLLKDKRIEVVDYVTDKSHSQIIQFFKEIQTHAILKDNQQKTINKPDSSKHIEEDDVTVISSKKFYENIKSDDVLSELRIASWNFQINSQHEHLFLTNERILLFNKLIVIIDDSFMKSKRLESILEYLIVNEQESNIKVFFIVYGETEIPISIRNKLYYNLHEVTKENIMNELKIIIPKIVEM